MQRKILFCLLIVPAAGFAQEVRKQLLGRIIADNLPVANVSIENESARTITKSDETGAFSLAAIKNDTLVVYGPNFETQILVLREEDFSAGFKIKLIGAANELDEVIVYQRKLTGDLEADSKNIKTFSTNLPSAKSLVEYYQDEGLVNIAMPNTSRSLGGMDLLKIGGLVAGVFGKPKPREPYVEPIKELFADVIRRRFSNYFLTQTLGLNEANVGLFLNFCDTPEGKKLLPIEKQFELTDYLIRMSAEFRELNQ